MWPRLLNRILRPCFLFFGPFSYFATVVLLTVFPCITTPLPYPIIHSHALTKVQTHAHPRLVIDHVEHCNRLRAQQDTVLGQRGNTVPKAMLALFSHRSNLMGISAELVAQALERHCSTSSITKWFTVWHCSAGYVQYASQATHLPIALSGSEFV